MRFISQSQEVYYARYGSYASLSQLKDTGFIDDKLATATEPATAKSGYYFTVTVKNGEFWNCLARPAVWSDIRKDPCNRQWLTDKNYLITEGIIYYNEEENSSEFVKKLGE